MIFFGEWKQLDLIISNLPLTTYYMNFFFSKSVNITKINHKARYSQIM